MRWKRLSTAFPITVWPPELGKPRGVSEGVLLGIPPPGVSGQWDSMTTDGRLYKLQNYYNDQQCEVLFYNATRGTVFYIGYEFTRDSQVTPGSRAVEHDVNSNILSGSIDPGQTIKFCSGVITGCKLNLTQSGVSEQFGDQLIVEKELSDVHKLIKSSPNNSSKDISAMCVNNKIPFVDLSFPPTSSSLGSGLPQYCWARPSHYLSGDISRNISVFGKSVEPNDIDQGLLGDAWFSCALAAAAEFPQILRTCFMATQEQVAERAYGAYSIRLCIHGWWQSIVVDDYLPVLGIEPAFARTVRNPTHLWVSLLQKAFAKARQSYASLQIGDPVEALLDLTGLPSRRFDWSDQQLFPKVEGLLKTPSFEGMILFHLSDRGNGDLFKQHGLIPGYSYCLLEAKTITTRGDESHQMLRIRNAWGDCSLYRGRWCSQDTAWHQYPEVAQSCGIQSGNGDGADGSFWIDWETARGWFDGGGIVHTTPHSWPEVRIASEIKSGEPFHILEVWLETPHSVDSFIGVHQRAGDQYAALLLTVIAPLPENGWTVHQNARSHGGRFCRARDISHPFTFAPVPGKVRRPYYIVCRCKDAVSCTVVLSIHAPSKFATIVVKRPTTRLLSSLRYTPIWKPGSDASFDPNGCVPIQAAQQLNIVQTQTSQTTHMTAMSDKPDLRPFQ